MKPYRAPKWLIITMLGVVFGLLGSGFIYFRMQQRTLREEAEKDLLGVAQVKLEQITAWREDQLAEGRELMSSSFLMRGINAWIRTRDEASEDLIRAEMQVLVDHYRYRDILMLTSGRPYREAWSRDKALEYIREQSGK